MVGPASWPVLFAFLYNPGDLGYILMGRHFSQETASVFAVIWLVQWTLWLLRLWTVCLLLYSSYECWFCFSKKQLNPCANSALERQPPPVCSLCLGWAAQIVPHVCGLGIARTLSRVPHRSEDLPFSGFLLPQTPGRCFRLKQPELHSPNVFEASETVGSSEFLLGFVINKLRSILG